MERLRVPAERCVRDEPVKPRPLEPIMDSKPWLKYYEPGLRPSLKPYPECTILDVVDDTVRERPDHTAIIFKGTRIPYADLDKLTSSFAAALVDLGVKKGERVALLLPNSPQAIIA